MSLFLKGESVYRVPKNVEAIQMEIMTHGPVQTVLRVYDDFLSYREGESPTKQTLSARRLSLSNVLQVFTSISKERQGSIMQSKFSDGVKRMVCRIG